MDVKAPKLTAFETVKFIDWCRHYAFFLCTEQEGKLKFAAVAELLWEVHPFGVYIVSVLSSCFLTNEKNFKTGVSASYLCYSKFYKQLKDQHYSVDTIKQLVLRKRRRRRITFVFFCKDREGPVHIISCNPYRHYHL